MGQKRATKAQPAVLQAFVDHEPQPSDGLVEAVEAALGELQRLRAEERSAVGRAAKKLLAKASYGEPSSREAVAYWKACWAARDKQAAVRSKR